MSTEEFSSMEKKVTLNWLLAFYGNLLTDIQWEMARLYWEEDYSLAEIAEQFSVSRQSVHDTVSRTEKKLEAWEEKLGMLRRFQAIEDGLNKCKNQLRLVKASEDTEIHLKNVCDLIDSLLDQEEE